ncbi:MAG: 4-alpha-glucanotransferase [bacterium]
MGTILLQDILGLGEEARLNQPARSETNWLWRLRPGQITDSLNGKLLEMKKFFRRES